MGRTKSSCSDHKRPEGTVNYAMQIGGTSPGPPQHSADRVVGDCVTEKILEILAESTGNITEAFATRIAIRYCLELGAAGGPMNGQELCAAVEDFGAGIKVSEELCEKGEPLTPILGMFYAMQSAFVIRVRLRTCAGEESESTTNVGIESGYVALGALPRFELVQSATQQFIVATKSDNRAAMSSALRKMGVFALCPDLETQVARMELVARSVTRRAQLNFFVELARFAAELGDYQRAKSYVAEARTLGPYSWELYNLCVIEGLIALNAGKHREAIQYLDKSILACMHDEYTLLSCGACLPNFALAEKLLHNGNRVDAVRHLLQSRDVWRWPPIDKWISTIEGGKAPDFRGTGVSRVPVFSCSLYMHYLRYVCGEERPSSSPPKSPDRVIAARDRLREEYKRKMDAAVKRNLENFYDGDGNG